MRTSRWSTIASVSLSLCFTSGHALSQALVGYDPKAPTSNFGSPGPTSNQVAYSISLSEDATNLYGTIEADTASGGAYDSGLLFANLYFGTGATATHRSTLGIEVTNDDAFYPGGSTTTSLAGTGFSFTENAATGVITFVLPWSFLESDPLGLGFDKVSVADPQVMLRLSQSFGYSVAGGIANFGADDLGVETLPVPQVSSWMLLFFGCVIGLASKVRLSTILISVRETSITCPSGAARLGFLPDQCSTAPDSSTNCSASVRESSSYEDNI